MKLYQQTHARMASLCAIELFQIGKKIEKLSYEVEARDLESQTIMKLVGEASSLRNQAARRWKAMTEDRISVSVMDALREEVSVEGKL